MEKIFLIIPSYGIFRARQTRTPPRAKAAAQSGPRLDLEIGIG
jgi:hypothetical protein